MGNPPGPSGNGEGQSTPHRILWSLAQMVLEGNVTAFSVQEVADRTGVSHRTVYRYFPTREALLEGLVDWVEDDLMRLGVSDRRGTIDDTADDVARKFTTFDQLREPLEAAVRFAIGSCLTVSSRLERTRAMREQVEAALPGVDEHEVELVFALVRMLGSSRAWLTMREDTGLPGAESGEASAWAIKTLMEAVLAGRGPVSSKPEKLAPFVPES